MPDPVIEPQPGSGEEPNAQSGSVAGESDGSGAGGQTGRTADQVRGELLRKQEKLHSEIAGLKGMVQSLLDANKSQQPAQQQQFGTPVAPGPVSPFGAPRPLANFSDGDLDVALNSPTMNAYQKEVIRREQAERYDERKFEQRFEQRHKQEQISTLKKESEKAALSAFPALRDSSSEFSRRVEAELASQRQLIGEVPTDKYDVANRIARSMGIDVSRAAVPGFTAPAGGGEDNRKQSEVQPSLSDDKIKELEARFAHTLPSDVDKDGKVVRRKFNTQRIKERSKDYKQVEGVARSRGYKVGGN